MPDANKLKGMAEAGFRIVDSCLTCKFGGTRRWGLCSRPGTAYLHGKHGTARSLPTHGALVCEHHERAEWVDGSLGEYRDKPWRGA